MEDYKKVRTTIDIFNALHSTHDLKVFSSYTASQGDYYGNPETCRIFTEWGLKGFDIPLCGKETTWNKDLNNPLNRLNEENKYWLCVWE